MRRNTLIKETYCDLQMSSRWGLESHAITVPPYWHIAETAVATVHIGTSTEEIKIYLFSVTSELGTGNTAKLHISTVGFMIDKVELGRVCLQALPFFLWQYHSTDAPYSSSSECCAHQRTSGRILEPSRIFSWRLRGAMDRNVLRHCYVDTSVRSC